MGLDDPRKPALETVLNTLIEVVLRKILGAQPARVTAYDSARRLVSAQPLVMNSFTEPDGSITKKPYPVVQDAPVLFLGGGGGYITTPVGVGDGCLLLFSSVSLERWRAVGGLVDPADDRRHDINDAIAIVGLSDSAHLPTAAPTDAIVLHAINGILIRLGSPDADGAVVVQSALDDFMSVLGGLAGTNPQLGALNTGLLALNSGAGWKAGTTKTKAE